MRRILIVLVFGILGCNSSAFGQCIDTLRVSLSENSAATIYSEFILQGNIADYSDLTWNQLTFNCSDLGENLYNISGYNQGIPFNCSGVIVIEDKLPPVVVVKSGVTLALSNGATSALIPVSLIDSGSYDNCSIDTFYMVPDIVFSSQSGTSLTIECYVVDESGNTNSAITTLNVESSSQALACDANLNIAVSKENPVQLLPENILESTPPPLVLLTLTDSQGNPVQDNLVTVDYIGQTLTATVNDIATGDSCWGSVSVEGLGFVVCDSESRCSDVGTCDSGHTLFDNIEWPCDLVLESDFNGTTADLYDLLTPSMLESSFGVDAQNTNPEIIDFSQGLIGVNYQDNVFNIEDGEIKILREWVVIDWVTACSYNYTQVLTIEYLGFEEIAFTWPDDITVSDVRIHPEELKRISSLSPALAEPSASLPVSFEFEDQLLIQNNTQFIVARNWQAKSINQGSLLASSVQNITVLFSDLESQVSVQDVVLGPIEGATVNTVLTDAVGLATTNVFPAEYTLVSENDPRNLNDIMELREHILGMKTMNPYQQIAGDVNGGDLTTLDLLAIQRHISQIDLLSEEYQFLDKLVDLNLPTYQESKIGYLEGNVVVDQVCPAQAQVAEGEYLLTLPEVEASEGSSGSFFIYANGHKDIESLTFALKYDPSVLSIDASQIVSEGLPEFLVAQPFIGNISFLWAFDPVTLSPCTPLFEVFYTVIGSTGQSTALFIDDFDNTLVTVTAGGMDVNVLKQQGSLTITDNPKTSRPQAFPMPIQDQLINAGQTYSFDLSIPEYDYAAKAIQVQFDLDLALIEEDIETELFFGDDSFAEGIVNAQGFYTLLMYNGNSEVLFEEEDLGESPIATLSFTAKENTLLSNIISAAGSSFATTPDDEVYLLDLTVIGQISTNTIDQNKTFALDLYPNPVQDYLSIQLTNAAGTTPRIYILDGQGRMVYQQDGLAAVDVSTYTVGTYQCVVQIDEYLEVQLFSKVK